jgi:mono/diheme cytochrome c family protein
MRLFTIGFVLLALVAGVAAYILTHQAPQGQTTIQADKKLEEADPKFALGKSLYENNCLQCHGNKGEGDGPAARYLYPRPRNFTEGMFRIVTSTNGKPTDKDLFLVITRGMSGSAMIPFGHLGENDRWALVGYVRHLWRASVAERLRKSSAESGEDIADAEVASAIDKVVAPGSNLEIAEAFPASSPESIAKGRVHYLKTCAPCHGDKGKGDGATEQKNLDGMPTRPRDLTLGYFKGTREPAQIFARIQLGMPGSPMPATVGFKPAEAGDLINYVNSLSDPNLAVKLEHRRSRILAKRVQQVSGAGASQDMWQSTAPAPIVVSPLWWREHVIPDFKVAAVHDGNTLAIRLTWRDLTRNDTVTRPEDFEDMAAVQLFKGSPEPFLGMGWENGNVDLWLWRASWQRRDLVQAGGWLEDYPFDTPTYGGLLKGKEKGVPDFLTARAAKNLNANFDATRSASNLAAKGFGSTTFRPKESQVVQAGAAWSDGQWEVVLRRPLVVRAEDGVSFAPGDQVSAAFAIWDGAARDRNGQKLFSIWHDLTLEQ